MSGFATHDTRRYASLAEAADYLGGGLSQRTIRRMIARGQIDAYRLGQRMLRVDLNQVDAMMRKVPANETE